MTNTPYGSAIRSMGDAQFSAWLTVQQFIYDNPQHAYALIDALILVGSQGMEEQQRQAAKDRADNEAFIYGFKGARE